MRMRKNAKCGMLDTKLENPFWIFHIELRFYIGFPFDRAFNMCHVGHDIWKLTLGVSRRL